MVNRIQSKEQTDFIGTRGTQQIQSNRKLKSIRPKNKMIDQVKTHQESLHLLRN